MFSFLISALFLADATIAFGQADGESGQCTQQACVETVGDNPPLCKDWMEAVYWAQMMPRPQPYPQAGCPEMSDEDKQKPLVGVSVGEGQHRSCLLDQSVCAAGHEMGNLSVWSRTWASSFAAIFGPMQSPWDYDDGSLRAAPGLWLLDAAYCSDSGILDIPNAAELLADPAKLSAKSKEMCEAVPEKVRTSVTASDWHGVIEKTQGAFDVMARTPRAQRTPVWGPQETATFTAGQCGADMQECMLYWCLDYFCKLPDGRVGAGCQCNKDYTWGMPEGYGA